MKKISTVLFAGSVCCLAAAGLAFAEEEKPSAELAMGAYSKYVWRGFELSDDSIVLQPSMTVGYKGFAFNLWGNLDTDYYAVDPNTKEFTEVDMTFSYDWMAGPVGMSAGYIYYGLDGLDDSQEIYLSAALDTLLSPTLSIYRDYDSYRGWYVTFGISHSVPVSGDISLDLGAQVSYMKSEDAESNWADPNDPSDEYSDFHDGMLSAALSIPINEYITISPEVYYVFALGSDADDLVESASIDGDDDSFIYGGVSVSFAF